MAGTYYFPGMDYEEEIAKSKILENQLTGSQNLKMPEMAAPESFSRAPIDLGGQAQSAAIKNQGITGEQAAQAALTGGTALAMTNPATAAMMVGGQLLAQSMANAAQAKAAQRQRAMEIAQQHSQGEQRGIDTMMSAWRNALR